MWQDCVYRKKAALAPFHVSTVQFNPPCIGSANVCERFNTELVGLTQKNNQKFSWAHLAKCFKCHRRSYSSYSQRARCPALGTIWKRWGGWGEKEGGMESLTLCLTLLRVIIMSGLKTLCRKS